MATLLALVVLWQFRMAVVYVLISLAVAAAVRPLVNRLGGRGIVVRMAWTLLCLVALVSLGFLLFLTVSAAVNEIQQLGRTLAVQGEWRLPIWLEGSAFQQALVTRLPTPDKLFEALTGDQGQLVLPAMLGLTQGMGTVVSGVLVVLLLSLYWSSSQIHFERLWLSLLPPGQRTQVRDIWRTIELEIGGYIRGQVAQGVLAGLLLGVGYWLIGSPYPALLALVGAVVCLIPMVGAPLALLPPLVVGLVTGVQLGLLTTLYTLMVLIVVWVWGKPRLFNRRWDNPVLTIVILIAMADAFGLLGIIIAPPLSAACQILWSSLVSRRAVSESAAQISDLKERQALVWATIKGMDEPPPPLVTSSMERLSHLLEKAGPVLAERSEPFHPSQPVTAAGELPVSTPMK